MLEHHLNHVAVLFLVLVYHCDWFRVVGHGLLCHLTGFGAGLDAAEELLDECFGVGHIHVAHHDDALVLGVVPLLIVVAQLLILEIVYHAH